MEIIKTDPYNRVLAVVHLLGGQYGSAELKEGDPRIEEAIKVVLAIEEKIGKNIGKKEYMMPLTND
jgi:hypothetical protein